jgi:hypothetical protein
MCASWTPTSHPATRRLVSDIRTLTDKPIRYVVNTHWHYHHTDGNQVFGPGVRIIGHENTRKTILAGVLHKRLEQAFRDLPNALANTRKRLAAEQNPSAKEQVQRQLAVQEAYQAQLKETVRDLWRQAKALHEQKVPVAEAAKRIDMTAHKAHFDNFTAPGIPEATAARLYQVLNQK